LRVLAGALLLSLVLSARRADAAPATRPILEALDVESVPCLNRDGLGAQLHTWLRRDRIDSRISIIVRPSTGEVSGPSVSFFILRDGKSVVERWLPHADVGCEQLRAAVGLAIAISVETMLVDTAEEPPPHPPNESLLDFVPVSAKPEGDERRFSFGLRLLGAPALLTRPALGLDAELSVRVVVPFEVNVSVMGTNPVRTPIGTGYGDLSLVAGRVDACVARYQSVLGSRACLGVAAGRLIADGTGYAYSYAPRMTWAAALARLELSVKVASGFRAAVGMDGILPFVVPRLEVMSTQKEVVASTTLPQFGAMFFVGPQVDF
jgi:hypothetical protein